MIHYICRRKMSHLIYLQMQAILRAYNVIQSCEFRDFFFEFNSLVSLPISTPTFDSAPYVLTLSHSTFTRFSTCGSVLSNYHIADLALYPPATREYWLTPNYAGYAFHWQRAANQYMERRYLMQKPSSYKEYNYLTDYVMSAMERYNTNKFERTVRIQGNKFSNFNYLKANHLQEDYFWLVALTDQVGNDTLKSFGYIIQFYDNFNKSYMAIEDNVFCDTFQALEVLEDAFFCYFTMYQSIFGSNKKFERYVQLQHIISITNITDSLIIINGNKFKNLSISGPLINLAEEYSHFHTPFIIGQNIFETIQGFVNSNIIQITRERMYYNEQIEEQSLLRPFVDTKPNFIETLIQQKMNKYHFENYLMAGQILIIDNTFKEICGQYRIDASVMLIGVRHGAYDERTNFMHHFPVWGPDFIDNELQPDVLQKEQIYFNRVPIYHPALGEISLLRMGVNISNNNYDSICMGVNRYMWPTTSEQDKYLFARGSLATFIYIPQVSISNEKYKDIGAYTPAYTDYIQMSIKQTSYIYRWTVIDDLEYSPYPFYLGRYPSSTLLFVQYCMQFNLTGANEFDNIWLFDRVDALTRTQKKGLILFLDYFIGDVTIGDSKEVTVFKNLKGFLTERNQAGNLMKIEFADYIDETYAQYGVGSVLFHIHNTSNLINQVVIQNIAIEDSFFASNKVAMYYDEQTVRLPAIVSTYMGDDGYSNFPYSVTLKGISFQKVDFDGISNYFELLAREINIEGLNFEKMGLNKYPDEDPFNQQICDNDRVTRDFKLQSSIIKIMLYSISSTKKQQVINISHSKFSQIDPIAGTMPIFEFNKGYDLVPEIFTNVAMTDVSIQDSLIKDDFSDENLQAGGSLFTVSTARDLNLNINLTGVNIQKVYSKYGLFETYGSITSIIIKDSHFEDVRGRDAGVMYVKANSVKALLIKDSVFKGNKMKPVAEKDLVIYSAVELSKIFNQPSMIRIISAPSVLIEGCRVSDHQFAKQGAFIDISQNSTVLIIGSLFSYLSAHLAGVLFITSMSEATIKDCTFENNCAISEGVFQAIIQSSINIESSRFFQNFAIHNGVFKVAGDSYFSFSDVIFSKNSAELKNSVGQAIQLGKRSFIKSGTFEYNNAYFSNFLHENDSQGKMLELAMNNVKVEIYDSVFRINQAKVGTSNVYIYESKNVVITGSIFEGQNNDSTKIQSNQISIEGDFLQIFANSNVTVSDTQFCRGLASSGGAIYIIGKSILTVSNTTFINNIATIQGGAIFADSFKSIALTNDCQFKNNQGVANGGDALYIYNSRDGQLSIKRASFTSEQFQSNFIYASDLYLVLIDSIQARVSNLTSVKSPKFSGFYLKNLAKLNLQNSTFIDIVGSSILGGGAVTIEYTSNVLITTVSISNCKFLNSTSKFNGGGLSLIDVERARINQSEFVMNKADIQGGALIHDCNQTGLLSYGCSLEISDTLFRSNIAKEGGALKWNYYEPVFRNVTFLNNTARYYGNDIASVPAKLIAHKNILEGVSRLIQSEDDSTSINSSSGGEIDLSFAIADKYGQVVKNNNQSKLYIQVVKDNKGKIKFTPLVETETQFLASEGVFDIQKLVLVGEPNSSSQLNFSTDAINTDIPSNSVILNAAIQLITINIRGCIAGEEMLSNGKCRQCQTGTYLLTVPTEPTQCLPCPSDKAYCYKGTQIYPLPGYWRSSIDSENFIKCLNPESCLGGMFPLDNLTGHCADGYQGVMCSSCSDGYYANYESQICKRCPSPSVNSLVIVAFGLLVIFVVILLVWSNLRIPGKAKNYMPVYLRILVNHLHVIALIASFEFNWPDQFVSFFRGIQPVSDAQSQILSIDCLFAQYKGEIKPFYGRTIMLAILPPIMLFLIVLFWAILQKIKQISTTRSEQSSAKLEQNDDVTSLDLESTRKSGLFSEGIHETDIDKQEGSMFGKIVLTAIVILFLMHPTIVKEMFNLFNCKNIEGIERLYMDLNVVCFEGLHSRAAQWIGIPSILVYGVGIPLMGFIVIFRNRNNLQRVLVRQRYGFLYNGYKEGKASYWEIFIMYRKMIIIFIQVYFVQNGKLVQALISLFFLCIFFLLVTQLQPYNKACLNKLEQISLFTSAASVYFCMYFISDEIDPSQLKYGKDAANIIMFAIIIILQACFFLYWANTFIQEFMHTIKTNYPRVYKLLLIFIKERSDEREIEIYKTKYITPFLDKLAHAETFIKKNRELYESNLVPTYDQELRDFVGKFNQMVLNDQRLSKLHSSRSLVAQVEEVVREKRQSMSKTAKIDQLHLSPRSPRLLRSQRSSMVLNTPNDGMSSNVSFKNQSLQSTSIIKARAERMPTLSTKQTIFELKLQQLEEVNDDKGKDPQEKPNFGKKIRGTMKKHNTFQSQTFGSPVIKIEKIQTFIEQDELKESSDETEELKSDDIIIIQSHRKLHKRQTLDYKKNLALKSALNSPQEQQFSKQFTVPKQTLDIERLSFNKSRRMGTIRQHRSMQSHTSTEEHVVSKGDEGAGGDNLEIQITERTSEGESPANRARKPTDLNVKDLHF
ncbi:hypothetical protein FGO68_gene10837 [Halteria grandinella]|uniref:DUF7630 domain-containing protein n=1 Tax=Halteria grandinella TaxID=5974 RepID=A0A8J8P6Q2_HALGN|nr:hypothetical protein FGO68_gene10837 [Halteria grandinella]